MVFILNIPIGRRPPHALDLEGRKAHILRWAEEETNGLDDLLFELQELVEPQGASRP